MPAAKFEITRQCKVCGETFVAKTIESWYCSPKCSKIAWKRRKDEELRLQRLDDVVKKIPKSKEYITVPEAYALFGISGKSSVSCPLKPSDSAPLKHSTMPP